MDELYFYCILAHISIGSLSYAPSPSETEKNVPFFPKTGMDFFLYNTSLL